MSVSTFLNKTILLYSIELYGFSIEHMKRTFSEKLKKSLVYKKMFVVFIRLILLFCSQALFNPFIF